jgi:D-hydroxyproline dehydrogenase subunit gamma
MFRRLHDPVETLRLSLDGETVAASPGDSVATVLVLAGRTVLRRTARSAAPRGLYCGMGVCFDCLVTIDGEPNRQACLVPAREGMVIETGSAAPQLASGDHP